MRFKSKLLSFQNTMSVWKKFQARYPNGDLSRFLQTDLYEESDDAIYFNSKKGQLIQVFDKSMSNKYYFNEEMKKYLGQPAVSTVNIVPAINLSNFPQELTLNTKAKLPVPALGHADKPRTFEFSNR